MRSRQVDMAKEYHIPVFLHEAIDGLIIRPSGIYVDCTYGGGGHSKEILKHLDNSGRLVAFDQDISAQKNLTEDSRLTFIPHNFRHLRRFLKLHEITSVNGILADLGVSSHQLDEPERGFSTRFASDLDMRMDLRQQVTASDILNSYSEERLQQLFSRYGEVRNAKTLAKTIVQSRRNVSLRSTDNFKQAIRTVIKGNPEKYLAQVFQALRIEVNDELGALKEMLEQAAEALLPGGRIVIITFHSLEDRIVKNFFKYEGFEQPETIDVFGNKPQSHLKIITKKPILPKPEEIRTNPRSRSAKLRIAEKTDAGN